MSFSIRSGLLWLGLSMASYAQATENFRLRFAWPDGLVASVQTLRTHTRQVNDSEPTIYSMSFRHTMQAQRTGKQHLISFSNFRLDEQEVSHPFPVAAQALAKASLPDLWISNEGAFIAVNDAPGFSAALQTVATSLETDELRNRLKAALDDVLTEPRLTNVAATDWNWLVGTWADAGTQEIFDLERAYYATIRATLNSPDRRVELDAALRLRRVLPCEREGRPRKCVEMFALVRPDSAALAKADANVLRHEVLLKLVTEPDTLIPHQYTIRKTSVISQGAADKAQTMRISDEVAHSFSYR